MKLQANKQNSTQSITISMPNIHTIIAYIIMKIIILCLYEGEKFDGKPNNASSWFIILRNCFKEYHVCNNLISACIPAIIWNILHCCLETTVTLLGRTIYSAVSFSHFLLSLPLFSIVDRWFFNQKQCNNFFQSKNEKSLAFKNRYYAAEVVM